MSSEQKSIALTRTEQKRAYYNAKAAVLQECEETLPEGDVIKHLAEAYTGHGGDVASICELVDETAAQNGDPVFAREELDSMSATELRRLAAEANTDAISGRNTRLEITAYFCCPYPGE